MGAEIRRLDRWRGRVAGWVTGAVAAADLAAAAPCERMAETACGADVSSGRHRFGQAFLQAGQQRVALELRDIVGEAGIAPASMSRGRHGPTARSCGSAAQGPDSRTARAKARPSISGISMSETIASNISPASRSRSASVAFGAAVTR